MQVCFITGLNRSGTTLLHSLLSGHPHIFATGFEDGMISGLARGGAEFERALQTRSPAKLFRALHYYTEYTHLKLMARRGLLSAGGPSRAVEFDFDFAAFEDDFLARIMEDRLAVNSIGELLVAFYSTLAQHWGEGNKPVIVAKPGTGAATFLAASPYLGDFCPLLLCIRRDPRAMISSNLARHSRTAVRTFTRDWQEDIEAVSTLRRMGAYPLQVVSYEALCEHPAEVMQQVAAFLQIPYHDSLTQPQIAGQDFQGNSSFEEIGAAISTEGIDRWRRHLSGAQIAEMERRLGPVLTGAGYTAAKSYPLAAVDDTWLRLRARMGRFLPRQRHTAAALAFGFGIILGIAATLIGLLLTK